MFELNNILTSHSLFSIAVVNCLYTFPHLVFLYYFITIPKSLGDFKILSDDEVDKYKVIFYMSIGSIIIGGIINCVVACCNHKKPTPLTYLSNILLFVCVLAIVSIIAVLSTLQYCDDDCSEMFVNNTKVLILGPGICAMLLLLLLKCTIWLEWL